MGKEKENKKDKRIVVGIYPDEVEVVGKRLEEEKHEFIGDDLSGKDIRTFFGLRPTHREGVKGELRKEIKELSVEEQKELLEEIKKKKGVSEE